MSRVLAAVRSRGEASGRGDGCSCNLTAYPKTRKASLVLPFISGDVDGVKPPHITEGKQELSGGMSS